LEEIPIKLFYPCPIGDHLLSIRGRTPPPCDIGDELGSRDGVDRKFVPAVRTASAASARTASAFVVHYPVRICAAPQSQSFTS